MAVEIELDLDASGATGKIGAVAASLKGLEQVADDIDIDFDADIGEITDEINKFSEALEGIDVDMENVGQDLRQAAKELDGAEVTVASVSPDGSTNDGDSTGGDPPDGLVTNLSRFGKDVDTSSASATDGGSRASIFERNYGPDAIHMSDNDIGEMLKTRSGGGLSNLGGSSPLVPDYDALERTGRRGKFGMEPDSMGRRNRDVLSNRRADRIDSELKGTDSVRQELSKRELAEINSGSRGGGFRLGSRTGKRKLLDTDFGERIKKVTSLKGALRGLNRTQSTLGDKLKRLKPSMSMMYSIIAAMVPIAIGLGTQLLGVAAAMGAVGAAGAGIIGLGLIGHAESMEGSFAQAKQQVKDLKSELFQEVQPLSQQFAPIQARMFDAIPQSMGGMFEEMEGLTQFEDTLFQAGGALTSGMEEFFAIINRNQAAISDLMADIGGLIGSGLLNFFEFLIKSASKNKQLIKDLGGALVSLAVIAYNVSLAISRVVATLEPAIDAVAWLSGFLNNKLIVAMLTAITVAALLSIGFIKTTLAVWGLIRGVGMLIAFLSTLGGGSILAGISVLFTEMLIYIEAAIAHFGALKFAALSAAAAIAATGIGALAVGAGIAAGGAMTSESVPDAPAGGGYGGSGGVGGGKTVYNDNRSYEINGGNMDDYATQKGVEDTITKRNETTDAQSLPEVQTSSESSDGGDNNS